ncbi:MAG TPA: hypothetical protein VK536_05430, partial [Candidatus Limnocylindrales bacterium]|nr:hypothetical protein [Candidatus Limnocylindrales bacterium]
LPSGVWVASGTTFTWTSTVSGGTGTQFVLSSSTGTSPITASQTYTATYTTQYKVTFTQTGITSAAGSNTVLTVGSTNYAYSALPNGVWVNSGTSFNWASPVSGGSGVQFILSTSSGSSPISSSGTYSATYTLQYQVSFTQTGITSAAGSNTVLTIGSNNYAYNALPSGTWVNSGTGFTWTSTVSGGTGVQFTLSSSTGTSPITTSGTYSATYTTQYQVTFTQSGITNAAGTNTVLTVGSTNYPYSTLPIGLWVNSGTTFTWTSTVSGGTGVRFVESSSSGSSPVTSSGTYSATYTTQYQVTFTQTGITGAAGSNTVLTLGSTNYAYNALPSSVWVNSGTAFTWASPVSGGAGVQFALSSSSGASPITTSGTYSATYTTQYQVTFAQSGLGTVSSTATVVTVAGTAITDAQLPYTSWFNAGSLTYSYTSPIGSSTSSTTGYYWSSTSGLGQTLQTNTFTVSGSGTITATYTSQTFGIASNCEGFGSILNGKTITTSSMTAQTKELIIVVITGNSNIPTVSTITDSFGTHLTYSSKISYTSASASQCLYVYYAVTGTQTGSFTITVTMSASDNYCVQAFGITGANTATPFDSNSNLPAKASGTSSSLPTVTGVYTSNANDMILAFEGQTSGATQTAGTSFTAPAALLNNANGLGNNVEYEMVSQTQSNVGVSFGTSVTPWIMAVEAVQRGW